MHRSAPLIALTLLLLGWALFSFNSLQQNPCLVAAYLVAVCNNGAFPIPALLTRNSYLGPSGSDDSILCKCNTVVYNLFSACDACQGASWIPYSEWSFNCTSKAIPGTFPKPVPDGTRIPHWAYIDTSIGDRWNLTAAKAIGDSPEVTGTVSIVTTSAKRSSVSASSLSLTPTQAPHSSSSNTGAIAGGIVGGIISVAFITWVVVRVVNRRRRRCYVPPSPTDTSYEWSEMELPVPYPLTIQPAPYDRSDSIKYLSKESVPVSDLVFNSITNLQPNDGKNGGLLEV